MQRDGPEEAHQRLRLVAARRVPGVGPPTLMFLALTTVYGAVVMFTAVFLTESGSGNPVLFFRVAMIAQVVAHPVSGRMSQRFAAPTVAVLGFEVWGHRLVYAGMAALLGPAIAVSNNRLGEFLLQTRIGNEILPSLMISRSS